MRMNRTNRKYKMEVDLQYQTLKINKLHRLHGTKRRFDRDYWKTIAIYYRVETNSFRINKQNRKKTFEKAIFFYHHVNYSYFLFKRNFIS